MAAVNPCYVDPSALLKLYLHEVESRAMSVWRARHREPITVTHHGRVELMNAIALAFFRRHVTEAAANAAFAALDDDFQQGRYVQADILWRATLNRAAELSREHSQICGARTLDVIHVASALELGFRRFVTFDDRQQELVRLVGLKLVVPATR